ncbi:unnamed protein product [Peronospora destructor]|uniref:Hcy-binding domain-containing protein n=1 Tax=Peronospora destructor TaxID=86335 RepID=A0AAV0V9W0_9STRA|nr:unnamed protein product [Peronospora destructor]
MALTGLKQLVVEKSRLIVLDGGLATELEKDPRVDLSTNSLWSASLLLDRNAHLQQVVVNVHKTYFLAGADVATTTSYQASADGFKHEGVTSIEDVEKLFARSIDLGVHARDAAWNEMDQSQRIKPLVGASIGCYGAALADGSEYRGDYGKSKEQLVAWHKHRFAFFANYAHVDLLICETIPCLVELLAVGINCTPPQQVESLLRELNCPWPKAVYPNSGEEWDGVNKKWLSADSGGGPSSWEELLPKWYDAGARFFGGCCRTSPNDIRAIRDYFERRQLL